jgi:hypothetical protein
MFASDSLAAMEGFFRICIFKVALLSIHMYLFCGIWFIKNIIYLSKFDFSRNIGLMEKFFLRKFDKFWLGNEKGKRTAWKNERKRLQSVIDFSWKLSVSKFFSKNFPFMGNSSPSLLDENSTKIYFDVRFKLDSCCARASSLVTKRFLILDVGISLLESCGRKHSH